MVESKDRASRRYGGRTKQQSNRNASHNKAAGNTRKTGPVHSQRVSGNSSRRVVSTYGASSALAAGGGMGGPRRVEGIAPDGVTRLDLTPQSLLRANAKATQAANNAKAKAREGASQGNVDDTRASSSSAKAKGSKMDKKSRTEGSEKLLRKTSSGVGRKSRGTETGSMYRSETKGNLGKSRPTAASMMRLNSQMSQMDDAERSEYERHEAFLKQKVEIRLDETTTETIFHIAGSAIPNDFRDYEEIKIRNTAYERMVEERKGSDNYTVRHTQTLNYSQKDKEAVANPPATSDAQCEASAFDIFDAMQKEVDVDAEELEAANMSLGQLKRGDSLGLTKTDNETQMQRQMREVVAVTISRPGCLLDTTQAIIPPPPQPIGQVPEKAGRGVAGAAYGDSGVFGGNSTSFNNRSGNTRTNAAGATSAIRGPGSNLDYKNSVEADNAAEEQINPKEILAEQEADKILNSNELSDSLRLVERAIQQNLFHSHHIIYRDYPMDELESEEEEGQTDAEEEQTDMHSRPMMPTNPVKRMSHSQRSGKSGADGESRSGAELSGRRSEKERTERPQDGKDEKVDDQEDDGTHESSIFGSFEQASKPRLEKLWSFKLTEENVCKTITAMSWNQVNPDVLAASYGAFHYSPGLEGRVYFWSLRNPEYPERSIKMESPATTLDFSKSRPNLLAVGMYNGAIAIYDTSRDGDDYHVPMRESSTSDGKHMDPVWQVRWLDKGVERGETLISISTDGRIVEWSMKKGLTYTSLMVLKCVGNTEGVISRQASGICLDFPLGDIGMYFAGTEDGVIHKCSPSYNEQSLETFIGHTGPVYRLRCSPFWKETFLSCSADWTVKLWVQKQTEPLYNYLSTDLSDEVCDVNWSPSNSTLFASVTGDGRIELWDLKVSQLDPIVRKFKRKMKAADTRPYTAESMMTKKITEEDPDDDSDGFGTKPLSPSHTLLPPEDLLNSSKSEKIKLTSVSFAINAPILVVGDSEGSIDVYRIHNIDTHPQVPFEDQVESLKTAIYPDGLPSNQIRRNS